MATSLADVCSLFDRYGCKYHQQDERTLLAGFRGTDTDFILGARLDRAWLTLSIVKCLPSIPPERREKALGYLLQLNQQITFVRFALESDVDVTLLADLPAQQKPDYESFAMTLDLLTFYANDSYRPLYRVITGEDAPKAERSDADHAG